MVNVFQYPSFFKDGKMNTNQKLRAIAAQQGGYFTSRQAAEAGYGKELQRYHWRMGNWRKVSRALYRLPGYDDRPAHIFSRWALWAAGQSGSRIVAISHGSALYYHGLVPDLPQVIDLTVSALRHDSSEPGCRLHLEQLFPEEYVAGPGFLITTPYRTLFDMRPDLLYAGQWQAVLRLARDKGLIEPGLVLALNNGVPIPGDHAGEARTAGAMVVGGGESMGSGRWRVEAGKQAWCTPNRSFTLIEMLIVIAIMAVMAGLLMPALQNALKATRQAACANLLRQSGLATKQYIGDHNGYYPAGYINDGKTSLDTGWNWCEATFDYFGSGTYASIGIPAEPSSYKIAFFTCPSDEGTPANGNSTWKRLSFAMNAQRSSVNAVRDGISYEYAPSRRPPSPTYTGDGNGEHTKESMIPAPGSTILYLDACLFTDNYGWRHGNGANSRGMWYNGGQTIFPWHNGMNNYLFCDGSLRSMLFEDTIGPGGSVGYNGFSNCQGMWTKYPSD